MFRRPCGVKGWCENVTRPDVETGLQQNGRHVTIVASQSVSRGYAGTTAVQEPMGDEFEQFSPVLPLQVATSPAGVDDGDSDGGDNGELAQQLMQDIGRFNPSTTATTRNP
jgi:hypothetical protein